MSPTRSTSRTTEKRRRHGLVAATVLAVSAFALWLPVSGNPDGDGLSVLDNAASAADGGEVFVAGSVCEAHELKAKKESNPRIQIEIPEQYDKAWPSANACASEKAALDPKSPGPVQPIGFSHKHHAGQFQIDCQYCHSGTDTSMAAGVPSVELCMGCHSRFAPEYDQIGSIKILKEHWEQKKPIEWVQIHRLPEHVQFRHNRHIAAGVECQKCHGPVEEMDKLYLVNDISFGYMPIQKLEMGWCIQCHRDNNQQASQDCLTCHY